MRAPAPRAAERRCGSASSSGVAACGVSTPWRAGRHAPVQVLTLVAALLQDVGLARNPCTAALLRGRTLFCQRETMQCESISGNRTAVWGIHCTGRASGWSHHRLSAERQVWAGADHWEGWEAQLACHRLEVHCVPSRSHIQSSSLGCHNSAVGPSLGHCWASGMPHITKAGLRLPMPCQMPMQWENIFPEASRSGVCAAWRRL